MTASALRVAPLGAKLGATACGAAILLLAAAVGAGHGVRSASAVTIVVVGLTLCHRSLFKWPSLLTAVLVVILFIPIRKYTLPANLPFQLEPYRVLIGIVALLWGASLLIDRRVRFARTVIDQQLAAVFAVSLWSIVANLSRIEALNVTSPAVKQLTFLVSFLLVIYLVASLLTDGRLIDRLLRVLVGGGTVVAALSLLEIWTGLNIFNHLDKVLPFLRNTRAPLEVTRSGHLRVVASSQHPIALGAMFVLLIPVAIYLLKSTGKKQWIASLGLLMLATLATGSRTAVLMLAVVLIVYLVLRFHETARWWPALIPVLVVVHIAMPGVIGGFYKSFFPQGGLVAEQADAGVGSSRVTSLGPGLHEINLHPVLGSGYGARIFHGAEANSFIVDDQWLSTGIETGMLGVLAWAWLFTRFLRRIFAAARRERGDRGWLFTAIAASVTAFVVGMFTYDAFSFIQTMFVLFFLLGLGCASLSLESERPAVQP